VAFICGAVKHAFSSASSISASGDTSLHGFKEYKNGMTALSTVFPDLHFTAQKEGRGRGNSVANVLKSLPVFGP
jgi:hypothetical protein